MASNSKQPQGALPFPDRGIIWKKSHNPHRGARLLKSKAANPKRNVQHQSIDILQLISVASHVLATMGLFHVRFGARPQAKPSIISVYKLSPISAK